MPTAALVSSRLGGTDGVSVEAAKWSWALGELGYEVRRIAGELGDRGADDVALPALAIDPPVGAGPAEPGSIARALDGADLVVVENVCSLPLNLDASRAVRDAVRTHGRAGAQVVLRHHDLPWQRPNLGHLAGEFPPDLPGAVHVTINLRSMRELHARGIPATAMPNRFDLDAPPGDREATRRSIGVADDELVLLHPARAIPRKNVPGAIRFAGRLARSLRDRPLRYWLTGPAEDGYAPTLERLLDACPVPSTTGRAPTAGDAYAAADVVLFPSTWEGFGNPVLESVAARRPLVVGDYPVLAEILANGFRFFAVDDPDDLTRWLRNPDPSLLERNWRRAQVNYRIEDLPAALDALLARRDRARR